MMDANDDWMESKATAFKNFIEDMNLCNPLYEKHRADGLPTTTYSRGRRGVDFMLIDDTLQQAVKRVGTLGLHESIVSDHVMLYINFDEKSLFKGLLNRPVMHPAREFTIEQADKADAFADKFRDYVSEKNFPQRVEDLQRNFRLHGASEINV